MDDSLLEQAHWIENHSITLCLKLLSISGLCYSLLAEFRVWKIRRSIDDDMRLFAEGVLSLSIAAQACLMFYILFSNSLSILHLAKVLSYTAFYFLFCALIKSTQDEVVKEQGNKTTS